MTREEEQALIDAAVAAGKVYRAALGECAAQVPSNMATLNRGRSRANAVGKNLTQSVVARTKKFKARGGTLDI